MNMRQRHFTFFEMMIVVALVALITALAAPKLTAVSKRMIVESSLTGIRQAITETAMRACATGQGLTLTLNLETSTFQVSQAQALLVNHWTPSPRPPADSAVKTSFIEVKPSYPLGQNIEWLPGDTGIGLNDLVEYVFFPDGQASGRPLRFAIKNRQFQLDVDRLTGNPLIQELE
jgi:type II secretory pathway pseudopilin PulG